MKAESILKSFPGHLAVVALASALAIPAGAQQTQNTPDSGAQSAPPAAAQQAPVDTQSNTQSGTDVNQQRLENAHKEGFWGHMQPFARKKWVKRQTQPINDRLTELDEVNAKNAKDIQDVDARAQAGIRQAQSTAEAANQTATAAGAKAQQANTVAQNASGRVDQINTTVQGLDQYKPVSEVNVAFRGGVPVLNAKAKHQLDQVVSSANGQQGYIVEVEAHSPARGAAGIQNSQRLAAAVNRYLVEHNIPVYRVHAVALGNAPLMASNDQDANSGAAPQRIRTSSVQVRLMENSLAAQGGAPPQDAMPSTGAERP